MGQKIEIKKVSQEVVVDIICDSCGESCIVDETTIENDKNPNKREVHREFEYMKLDAGWGYHSNNKDMERWTAFICESCVDEHLGFIKFKKRGMKFNTSIG